MAGDAAALVELLTTRGVAGASTVSVWRGAATASSPPLVAEMPIANPPIASAAAPAQPATLRFTP